MPVRDLLVDEKFKALSPAAQKLVFEKVSATDAAYSQLSKPAQQIIQGKLFPQPSPQSSQGKAPGQIQLQYLTMEDVLGTGRLKDQPHRGPIVNEWPGVELSRQLGYNALPGALGNVAKPQGLLSKVFGFLKREEAAKTPPPPPAPRPVPQAPKALAAAPNQPAALASAAGKSNVPGPARTFAAENPQLMVEIQDAQGNVIGHTTAAPSTPQGGSAVSVGASNAADKPGVMQLGGGTKRQAIVDKATGRITGYIQEGPHGTRQTYEAAKGVEPDVSDSLRKYRLIPEAVEKHLRNANPQELQSMLARAKDMQKQRLGGADDLRQAVEAEIARRKGATGIPAPSSQAASPPLVEGHQIKPGGVFDPKVPADKNLTSTYLSRLRDWWTAHVVEKLPQEARLVRNVPQTPVISEVETLTKNLSDKLTKIVERMKSLHRFTPEEWEAAEHKALQVYRTTGSKQQAIASLPPELQEYARMRDAFFAEEQQARHLLGLDPSAEIAGPYLPRRTVDASRNAIKVFRHEGGYGVELKTSEGSFGQHRTGDMSRLEQRIRNGVAYEDPRITALAREWTGLRLRETGRFISRLRNKILFESREAARLANGGKDVAEIEFIPGGRKWYTTSREEGIFLKHQFQEHMSSLGGVSQYMNSIFRNPNLFNPLPHFLKNMLYKFKLAGGSLTSLPQRFNEFFKNPDPKIMAAFEEVMGYSQTGKVPYQIMREALADLNPSQAGRVGAKMLRTLTNINHLSSQAIFKWGDPFLRYSLWRKYLAEGKTVQEAANHAWVDLIRYSTRSELVDLLKSIPGNFFVPWRYGSLTSLKKQMFSHPMRTVAVVGTIDVLREAYHRRTGRWLHLPIDYFEAPVAKMLQDPKSAGQFITSLVNVRALQDVTEILNGSADWDRIRNLFWGWSQLYETKKEWEAFQKDGKMLPHLFNFLSGLALGTHPTYEYNPWRFGSAIPESLLPKSQIVKQKEAMIERKKAIKDKIDARKQVTKPYRTNEFKLTGQ